jgi:hypothetical protein
LASDMVDLICFCFKLINVISVFISGDFHEGYS